MAKIITEYLDNISSKVFEDYAMVINNLIRHKHGIYALYKRDKLYYVGKAVNLKNRIKQHLRDKHSNKWDTFSLFVIKNEGHISDIESILIAVNSPQGNKISPRNKAKNLKRLLAQALNNYNEDDVNKMLCVEKEHKGKSIRKKLVKIKKSFVPLYAYYNGKEYRAVLIEPNKIKYKGKIYLSPSAAARAIVKTHCDGKNFWKVEYRKGMLKSLIEYLGK
ncbi:MAG: GIY-YIG nuclease family protein [Elusimicrobiota bacterium]|jgi:hypothetical protein|nr:GIY-YIG nuclease family protein [Elusimicrobiota bacterium]